MARLTIVRRRREMANRTCPLCGGEAILRTCGGYEICLVCGTKFKRNEERPDKIEVVWAPESIMEARYGKVV